MQTLVRNVGQGQNAPETSVQRHGREVARGGSANRAQKRYGVTPYSTTTPLSCHHHPSTDTVPLHRPHIGHSPSHVKPYAHDHPEGGRATRKIGSTIASSRRVLDKLERPRSAHLHGIEVREGALRHPGTKVRNSSGTGRALLRSRTVLRRWNMTWTAFSSSRHLDRKRNGRSAVSTPIMPHEQHNLKTCSQR